MEPTLNYSHTSYLAQGQQLKWEGEFESIYSNMYTPARKIGQVPVLSRTQALLALDAAVESYNKGRGAWPTAPARLRIEAMERFLEAFKAKKSVLVEALMLEIGKNKSDSEKEIDRTIYFIEETLSLYKTQDYESGRFQKTEGVYGLVRRGPLGVVLCMGPYNYPINETFALLIPALLMGNTVVVKPPKHGILATALLEKAFADSFPKGVINIVYGSGQELAGPIMQTGLVNVLAFIGGSKAAKILQEQHPQKNRLRTVFSLEAKNPAIILEDADMATAVKECVLGALSFNGQRCTAIKMIYVQNSIKAQFTQAFAQAVDELILEQPWQSNPMLTPLPGQEQLNYIQGLWEDAQAKGAKAANQKGGKLEGTAFFPVVVTDLTREMKLYHQEQFGPLVPIVGFDSIDEPIDDLAESNYGQQVALFGTQAQTLGPLIDGLTNLACRVNINSQCQRGPDVYPFTGRKDSAAGTLSIQDGLRSFSIRTMVAAKENPATTALLREIVDTQASHFIKTDPMI